MVLLVLLATPALGLEAGAAKSRLTVPAGTPLGGYPDRLGRDSLGEHDGLWSRCLYLDDSQTRIYLVSLDLPHIPRALRDRVVELAADFAPKETIFLSATGTRNGPGGMDQSLLMRWTSGRYYPETLEIVAQSVVATLESARDQKRRATLGHATAKQQALTQNRFISDGPTDDQIGVIRVDDADGKAISVIASLAARPELAPESHRYHLSADFPGAFYRFMEEQTTPDCVVMFLPGATADQTAGNPENLEGWERVDAIGRLLALRAKEATNEMAYRDVTLKVAYAEAALPRTLAQGALPATAIFQLLEIDGLQLLFIPGEPSVEIAQALRREALAAGKDTHFTVGLANENIGSFVARARYGDPRYLPAATPFGPDAENWLQTQAAALIQGGAGEKPPEFLALKPAKLPGSVSVTLSGAGYARGYQRGAMVGETLQTRWEAEVLAPVHDGTLRPAGDTWKLWPSLLDLAPLALPALGMESRPMLQGLGDDILLEAEGFAAGAGLPFDGALMLQQTPKSDRVTAEEAAAALSGTQFVITGKRAGNDGVLVASNFDAPGAVAPIVTTVEPETGHNFVALGFDTQLGALAGMNDAGLVLGLARHAGLGEAALGGASAALALRHELQFTATYEDALARLRPSGQLRGYQVLVAGQSKKGWRGAVLSFGKTVSVREIEDGILLGLDPESGSGDGAAQERYATTASLLNPEVAAPADTDSAAVKKTEKKVEVPLTIADLQKVLAAGVGGDGATNRPWNADTRHSVVFVPGTLTLLVAFPNVQGAPGAYTEFRIKKAVRDE